MNILIFQHAGNEHAGLFRGFAKEDGHDLTVVRVDAGTALPDIAGYDALWVLGGAMDVWQEDEHPWLADEKAYIRDAVQGRGVPFLGICLGHQLLADALGGEVGKAATPEIGVSQVTLTEAGATGVLFDGLPEQFGILQWHGAEVTRLPEGAQVLATSPDCAVQAMKWGTRAASIQFHLEARSDLLDEWLAIPSYADALADAIGADKVPDLKKAFEAEAPRTADLAERFYINWLQMTSRAG